MYRPIYRPTSPCTGLYSGIALYAGPYPYTAYTAYSLYSRIYRIWAYIPVYGPISLYRPIGPYSHIGPYSPNTGI